MPDLKNILAHRTTQRSLFVTFILTELSHVFCCILPTVITVVSLLSSIGLSFQMPAFMMGFHHIIHAYEIPVMIFSGAMLAAGWAAFYLAARAACQDGSCAQHLGPAGDTCTPSKKNTRLVLILATILFVVNVTVYITLHRGMDANMQRPLSKEEAPMAHHHSMPGM